MSYVPDYTDCWGKLDRAKTHRDQLYRAIMVMRLNERHRIDLRSEFDSKNGCYIFYVAAIPAGIYGLARDWSIAVGDVLHNLRCVIDYIAWQLALELTDGADPVWPTSVKFPIEESGDLPARLVAQLLPERSTFIQGFQPDRAWPGPKRRIGPVPVHPLLTLKRLSNDDKHKVITKLELRNDNFGFVGGPIPNAVEVDFRDAPKSLEVGTEVVKVFVSPPPADPDVQVHGYVTPSVILANGESIIWGMDRLVEAVTYVLRELDPVP